MKNRKICYFMCWLLAVLLISLHTGMRVQAFAGSLNPTESASESSHESTEYGETTESKEESAAETSGEAFTEDAGSAAENSSDEGMESTVENASGKEAEVGGENSSSKEAESESDSSSETYHSSSTEETTEAAVARSPIDYTPAKELIHSWWDSVRIAFVTKILQLILAFLIFFVGKRVIAGFIRVMDKISAKKGWDPTVCSFARNAARAVLYAVLLLIILTCVGFEVASLAAVISSIGIALGLALQGSLSNLAGGILISVMKPIHLGDFITVGGFSGTVREIGLVYTTLVGADDRTVVIPNGMLAGTTIENYSEQTTRRVEVRCSIAYSANLKLAKSIFADVIEAIPERLPDKPVNVFVAELADNGVVLEGQLYVAWNQYLSALWAVRENVKLAFDTAGIEIPFPQIDVHMKAEISDEKKTVEISEETRQ